VAKLGISFSQARTALEPCHLQNLSALNQNNERDSVNYIRC